MVTATGSRQVPFPRKRVWQALSALTPYCSVCDVSYVLGDDVGVLGMGTRFVCVAGRLDGAEPPRTAPQGEIVEWDPPRRIATRLVLTPETWLTDLELDPVQAGATKVTVTISREPTGGSRLVNGLQRRSMQRLVQRTVDAELEKLPDHINLLQDG